MSIGYTHAEWEEKGAELFGDNKRKWKFVCPCCGQVTAVQEWLDSDAEGQIGYSCIGRSTKSKREALGGDGKGPCNYAGGGLFRLNPVKVSFEDGSDCDYFDFHHE